jgi:hypothetical protein
LPSKTRGVATAAARCFRRSGQRRFRTRTRGGKLAGGDLIDLQNQEFATVRDQVCECKNEKCARDALARMDEIMKRTGESGLTPSKEPASCSTRWQRA